MEAVDIQAANNRLLERRERLRVTEDHTPSTRFAPRDVFPRCEHGNKRGYCKECLAREESVDEERRIKEEEHQAEEKKKRAEAEAYLFDHPDQVMQGIMPLKFIECSLDKFQGGEMAKKKCHEFVVEMIQEAKGVGILFTGATGSGKTHLAVAIVRELVRRGSPLTKMLAYGGVEFTTMPELLMEIRATYNSKRPDAETEADVVNRYAGCGLLVLDDLGAEKVSDFSITTLYLIIDRRNRELKPTVVTTNLTLEQIGAQIDERIASRLSEMKIVQIAMPDYRKKRAAV